jgi:TonB-linked SusC/RagA family outer membrane protein
MEKRLTMFFAALFLMIGTALAQTKVNGTVISQDDNEPVIGASVLVVGTQVGTVTDANGQFSLTVPAGKSTLRITYVGMEPIEVSARPNMRILLTSDQKALDEVIVVAYGTQKKASFTGAASTIKSDKIEKLQVSNLSNAFEGQVAGVQSFSSSGTPGSGSTILIRGIGSISGTQTPLIVVDGVPYEGSLNSIPTQDIENITILKDAAANSMYGARGANGVIMVTTKGSKTGRAKVNFEARWGFNTRGVKNYDIISDAGEYYEMMYESYRNSLVEEMGWAEASNYAAENLIGKILKYNKFKGIADNAIIDPATGRLNPLAKTYKWGDDWQKDPFENGFRHEYNANISGGSESTKAYLSLGYLGDDGYVVGSGFKRYNARLKVDHQINKNIRLGGNIFYSHTDQRTFGLTGNYAQNIFLTAQTIAPIYSIYLYDQDGNPVLDDNGDRVYDYGDITGRPTSLNSNPIAQAKLNNNQTERDNLSTRGYFEWTFLKDFKFTANVAYDLFNTYGSEFQTPVGGDAKKVGGRGEKETTRYAAINLNQLLDWNHQFGDHSVHVLLGHETKKDKSKYMYGHMTNFADPTNPEFANATVYQELTSYTSEYALEGYFAKGEYNYLDRYYFTTSIRRDGSSRFHKDKRWGTFWSIGGSWRLKEEPWLKNVNWLSALKLKASYGTQGNDNVGYAHNYTDLYNVDRVDGSAALSKVNRGNPDLTWEKSKNFNVGFEAGFWNRLNVSFDFFVKKTSDMLYASPLAPSEGKPSTIYRNEMDMKNTGFEIEISGDIIKTKNVRWNAALNLTHYKNQLTRLPVSKPAELYPDGYQAGDYWRKIGGSLYDWYLYEYAGVDPTNGLPQYNKYVTDEDGNETIELVNTITDATQRQTGKSAIPDLTGGFSTTVEAYGFDLSIQTAFQFGGYVFDSFYNTLMTSGGMGSNFHKDMFNRWTPNHTDTNIPRLFYMGSNEGISGNSDFYLTKAGYFSLKNITLGYTIPKKITSKWGIENLRVYIVGDNIWLKSNRRGLDPRQSISGATSSVYSALSSYSFGINVSF